MIINNTYFKGEIYIPHARPSITDEVSEVEDDIVDFINEYARECLLRCLGAQLFHEFEKVLDPTKPNGLKDDSDEKWDKLLNGTTYQDPVTSKTVHWRGIRYKSKPNGDYDKSFLAEYVYFYYEKHDYITRSDIGHVKENGKNSWNESPRDKVTRAYNKFIDKVQGRVAKPSLMVKYGFLGVDYTGGGINLETPLYKFIEDSNKIAENTYADFEPAEWHRINQFGL